MTHFLSRLTKTIKPDDDRKVRIRFFNLVFHKIKFEFRVFGACSYRNRWSVTANPDGIIKARPNCEIFHFALEYEASSKFAKRYKALMHRYYTNDEARSVLFISKNLAIQNKVMHGA